MGLRKSFDAADPVSYRLAADIDPVIYGEITFHPELTTPPRVYGEELSALGAVWGGRDGNRYGPSTFSVLGTTNQIYWPSWGINRWRFDGQAGRLLERQTDVALSAVIATNPRFAVEPSGALWWWGTPYYPAYASALDGDTFAAAGLSVGGADFGAASGFRDFNVDRAADRVFVRPASNNAGQISIWRLSTKAKIADIWTPGATKGIVLTHDGYVYVVDELAWLCCYDYDGRLCGALKASRPPASPLGVVYGWDPYYKRLLRVVGTANAPDGASTMRVEGYYPQPEEWTLTPPVPLKVPRKSRPVYSFAHVAGEGGEPMAARRVTFTAGISSSTVAADANGDGLAQLTPDAAGALLVEVTT